MPAAVTVAAQGVSGFAKPYGALAIAISKDLIDMTPRLAEQIADRCGAKPPRAPCDSRP